MIYISLLFLLVAFVLNLIKQCQRFQNKEQLRYAIYCFIGIAVFIVLFC